jgi:catechol 2,3-dioxygenase-like lactoylglutathione lyase family enzyme
MSTQATTSMTLKNNPTFSSFSVDDLEKAKGFYGGVLGLDVAERKGMGLELRLAHGNRVFLYPKKDHRAATFTVLNFLVPDIDAAVDGLTAAGVRFERYQGEIGTDEKGVHRSGSAKDGPSIAWFKDPSGNVLSVLEET